MNGELAYELELRRARVAPPDDRARFERLLDRHDRRLRRFVAGIVADRHRCDDVLQEAYLKAYRRLPARFDTDAQETAWLYRVVYRCCLDELRRAKRDAADELVEGTAADADVDRALALSCVLRTLRPADRAVIFLVGIAGLEHREAGAVLGIARGTVSWRLSVARTRFRELLVAEGLADA
jgi:RNA polymerase sigma-70 factor, ECF subfamily